jgi:hypothetical protein
MEHDASAGIDEAGHERGIGYVTPYGLDARIGWTIAGQDAVGKDDAAKRKHLIVRIAELRPRGQRTRQRRADETGCAGDDDFHVPPGRAGSGNADLL